ncbi:MAG TPA: hypothetical protein VGQ09_16195 [Chitinophagaceae bacterium]|jgi:hypothetical protein|nr:hypothetical protein [Chitinophagaceae bacterium]
MKKWIIGSLVGAIIVFAWQALSWMLIDLHAGEHKYTAAQDQIKATLEANLTEDGMYMIPNSKPGSSRQEMENDWNNAAGKPWALITYGKSFSTSMTTPMIIGFVIDIILVILLISILTRGGLPSFIGIFTGAIAVGIFTFLWGPYMLHNWYNVSWSGITGHLIDAIVAWGLCGLWLGWWLRRPAN